MTKIRILFKIAEHKGVLENTLTLPGFILEHWLCSSSFSTSWAITWLPAKASDNQSIKIVFCICMSLLYWLTISEMQKYEKQHLSFKNTNRKLC